MSNLFAQSISDYAYVGSEGTSLCGAVTANPGGLWSLYHNPAGLSEIENSQFEMGVSELYSQSYLPYSNTGAVITTSSFGNFGVSIQQMAIKYGGNTISSETSAGLSHGFFLLNDMNSTLSAGYTLNYLYWELGKSAGDTGDGSNGFDLGSNNTIGVDLGIQSSLRNKHRVGVFMKNINQPEIGKGVSKQTLPRRMSIGIAYTPINGILTSLVMDRLFGDEIQIKSGFSYNLTKILNLSLGLQSNPNRMGGGIEIQYSGFAINYSFITHHVLPNTHHISLGYKLQK